MSLKIGIVTEYYYPLLGGISESVHNTAARLTAQGHTVKIITSNLGPHDLRNAQNGPPPPADIIRIGRSFSIYSNGSMARVTMGKRLTGKLRATFEREKFDLLHLHSPLVPTLPMFAQFAARCPTVGTFHTYFDRSIWYTFLKGKVQTKLVNRLGGQIAVSQSCIDALKPFLRINARIIPNGVNISEFNPDVPRLPQFDDEKKNLLFLGRLDPRNGLALMIQAFGIVRSRYPGVRLIIVGAGPLMKYYKRLVPEELAPDIHLAGPVLQERNRYYSSCDIFCSPVEKASFGITLLEAMASGKPIVAIDNCGYREILGPKEGALVPPRDPEAFAGAILKLLQDQDLRKETGMNGRAKALEFSWDKVVGELTGFYTEVLKRQ